MGTGIAGSSLAFELEKRKKKYLICTEQHNPMANTSTLSYGHCRVPRSEEAVERIVRKSVSKLGDDKETLEFVYSQSKAVPELYNELCIDFQYRSFGVIPSIECRGGGVILYRLQENIPLFYLNTELVDFSRNNDIFAIHFDRNGTKAFAESKYLVLCTGGYGGTFEHTDCFRYKSYNIFDIVEKNGGNVINLDSIFIHPFGYNKGKNILTGKETQKGNFIDSEGNPIFDKRTRNLVKNNDYHEIFDNILRQISERKSKGLGVYFEDSKRRIEITPTVHYTAGGIETNYLGEVAGCENLFAIGECRADGSRNGGRFPGYPFTAAIVYGKYLGRKLSL